MATYPAGSNETSLLSRNSGAGDGRGFTNVLVVTTTVRVIDGVHGNTTSTRPAKKRRSRSAPLRYSPHLQPLSYLLRLALYL